jgi:hypothetical protein
VTLLTEAPILAQIRWLDLTRNEIGLQGARALANCPLLERIEHIDVFGSNLGGGLPFLQKRFGKRLWHSADRERPAPHTLR